jgi:hypothetical protein
MSSKGKMNPESKPRVRLDIPGIHKRKDIRIAGTIHNHFAIPGMWLRGTLHCHLGGHRRAEWVAAAGEHYRRLGYDFLAGMDHDMIVPIDPGHDMLAVPGAEVSGPGHVLALGVDSLPEPAQEGDMVQRTATAIRRIKDMGGIAILAHPVKSGYTWEQLNILCDAGLDGMEIVNSSVRGKGADAGRSDQIWHLLLRDGRSLVAIGNDDAHGPHEDLVESGWGGVSHAAWTGVLAREFSVAGVLEAIREGRTYASEGPQIWGIEFREDGKLIVSTSPCVACHFKSVGRGRGRSGSSAYPPPGEASSERFVLDFGVAGYRVQDRLVIVPEDVYGRRAWVSPISLGLTMHEVPEGSQTGAC